MAETDVSKTFVDRGQRAGAEAPSGDSWAALDPSDSGSLAEMEEVEPVFEPPGRVIGGRYRIERPLAQGGMGSVYLATQLGLDRRVALKALSSNEPELLERFRREAVALADVSHPGVVEIYDFIQGSEETSGRCYLIMAFIDGTDLESHVRTQPDRRLKPDAVVELVLPVVSALVELHASGIIHRDLKPANLVRHVRVDGRAFAKLVDFGIARREVDPGLTATGSVLGTPAYLAPEALFGRKQTPQSDVYSLGATLFELLAGAPPFGDGKPVEIIRRVMQHHIALPSEVAGTPLGELIVSMLEMEPGKRPTSLQVLEAFERLAHGFGERPPDSPLLGPAQAPAPSPAPTVQAAPPDAPAPASSDPFASSPGVEAVPFVEHTDPVLRALPSSGLPRAPGSPARQRALVLGLGAGVVALSLALTLVAWQWRAAVAEQGSRDATTKDAAASRSQPPPPNRVRPEPPRTVTEPRAARGAGDQTEARRAAEGPAAAPPTTEPARAADARPRRAADEHGPSTEMLRESCRSARDAKILYRTARRSFEKRSGDSERQRRAFEALRDAPCAPGWIHWNAAIYLVKFYLQKRDCAQARIAQKELESLARRVGKRPPRFPGCVP